MEINIERLQRFVKTLQAIRQDMPICILSRENPQCGTPGCHAGLVMLALDKMRIKQTEYYINKGYDFRDQGDRLARYLFAHKERHKLDLENWAGENPEIWGNDYGDNLFFAAEAFDKDTYRFPSSVIVNHWAGVLDRPTEHRKVS